ncbi:MAG: S41 family peptidase [Muribaculaceae bacterium]|nr:S41 family peptidase [Muribaculaceae bacterium]
MKTQRLRYYILGVTFVLAALLSLPGCHKVENWDNDLYGNFDALWTILDEHYCFFEDKDVDWDAVRTHYRSQLKPGMDYNEFFDVCSAMLDELRDGHTNLISWFDVSYYRQWWTDYPQNFNLRIVQQYYLNFDYHSSGGMIWGKLPDCNVGYLYYSSFSSPVNSSFIDNMMLSLKDCDGLIIDVRDNGGGDIDNVRKLVGHFISERISGGYIRHKTGPGHSDFSEPYEFFIDTAEGHVRWLKYVVVLANRSTFSAANNFVSVMKPLPHVLVAGDTTGGGSGMPFSSELPCGWSVRFSACPVYDADMNLTEYGVEPSEGCKVDMDAQAALRGHDTIIDFAVLAITTAAEEHGRFVAPQSTGFEH